MLIYVINAPSPVGQHSVTLKTVGLLWCNEAIWFCVGGKPQGYSQQSWLFALSQISSSFISLLQHKTTSHWPTKGHDQCDFWALWSTWCFLMDLSVYSNVLLANVFNPILRQNYCSGQAVIEWGVISRLHPVVDEWNVLTWSRECLQRTTYLVLWETCYELNRSTSIKRHTESTQAPKSASVPVRNILSHFLNPYHGWMVLR